MFASEPRLIKLPEVIRKTGKSRSSLYAAMREGKFPPSVAIGPRARAWVEAEINSWVDARVEEARSVSV